MRERQGWDPPGHLARHTKRLLAGRQHGQLPTGAEKELDEPRTRIDEMLAAVQDEERLPVSQMPRQRLIERFARPLAHIQDRSDRLGKQAFLEDRSQGHQPDPFRVVARGGSRQPQSEPGFPRAADARQGQQPGANQNLAQLVELARAAHEATELDRQVIQRPTLPLDRSLGAGSG